MPVASPPGSKAVSDPNLTPREDVAGKATGRLIVIIPASIVLVVGLYTGYAAGVYMGQSKLDALLWSVASMLLTGVIVALLVWDRRRKLGR